MQCYSTRRDLFDTAVQTSHIGAVLCRSCDRTKILVLRMRTPTVGCCGPRNWSAYRMSAVSACPHNLI